MKEIKILGKKYPIVERKSKGDTVQLRNNGIFLHVYKRPVNTLLKDFLAELLYAQLYKIYGEIKKEGKIEVLGNLDFEIAESIDGKKKRIAKLKGNKIFVKLDAVKLPENALRYLLAHEISHTLTKQHTRKFWKIVETIYPNYEVAQKLLMKGTR